MPAKWMLVIAATDFVRETYAAVPEARTVEFGKTYQGHILNRNDRGAVYLMITNYGIPAPDCARRGTERLQGRLPAAGELADGMPASASSRPTTADAGLAGVRGGMRWRDAEDADGQGRVGRVAR